MEDRDSTGILPVECHNLQDLVSLHFICLRKVGIGCVTSLENRPAGLSRPAPARCNGPGVAIVAIITSDVLVPVIGRARGGLGFGWVTRFVWVQCTPSQSRPGVNWLPGRGPGGAVCTQGLSRAAALHHIESAVPNPALWLAWASVKSWSPCGGPGRCPMTGMSSRWRCPRRMSDTSRKVTHCSNADKHVYVTCKNKQ